MMKGGRSRDVRIKEILKETILALLNNGVEFTSELQVDGLLGVTVDQNDVFLVRINEIVPSLKRQLGGHDSEPHHGDSSEEETAPKSAPPQQSKAQRRKRRSPSPKQSASGKNEKRARTTSPTQAIPSSTSTKDVKSEGGTDYGAVDIDLTNVKMEPVDTTVADSNNSGDFDFSNRQQLNHPAVITSIQSVAESEWQGGQQQQQQQQEMANAQLQQQPELLIECTEGYTLSQPSSDGETESAEDVEKEDPKDMTFKIEPNDSYEEDDDNDKDDEDDALEETEESRLTDNEDYEKTLSATTIRTNRSNMKIVYDHLQNEENEHRLIQDIPYKELNVYLTRFFRNVRKIDGQDYMPASLSAIFSSINRVLRTANYSHRVSHAPQFETCRQAIVQRKKKMEKDGKLNNTPSVLKPADVDRLFKEGHLGIENPASMLTTLWLFNTVYFHIKPDQQRDLSWDAFVLKKADNGKEYIEYTNTKSGEREIVFANTNNPSRCPIVTYKAYAERRSASTSNAFYLSPSQHWMTKSNDWFMHSQPLGINKSRGLMKQAGLKVGLKNISGHSVFKQRLLWSSCLNLPVKADGSAPTYSLMAGVQPAANLQQPSTSQTQQLLFILPVQPGPSNNQ